MRCERVPGTVTQFWDRCNTVRHAACYACEALKKSENGKIVLIFPRVAPDDLFVKQPNPQTPLPLTCPTRVITTAANGKTALRLACANRATRDKGTDY